MKKTDLQKEIRRGHATIWAYVVIFSTLTAVGSFNAFVFFKRQLAAVSLLQSQAEFIRGDFRSGLSAMYGSVGGQFERLIFTDRDGSILIQIPPTNFSKNFLFYDLPLEIEPKGFTRPIGAVVFRFDLSALIAANLGLLILEIILLTLISGRLRRIFEARFNARIESEKILALNELSVQVAHDIRSPLAVLEIAQEESAELPESTRAYIQGAISQIRMISEQMLAASRANSMGPTVEKSDVEVVSLLKDLVTVKRLELGRNNPPVTLDLKIEIKSAFIEANASAIKRVLSNLINNAAEALNSNGQILVSIDNIEHVISITVTDDGNGISPEIIKRLGQRGATFGKKNGNGLGLSHAYRTCAAFGGNLTIQSSPGRGTSVKISFPELPAKTPLADWTDLEKSLDPNERTVDAILLDDDEAIVRLWTLVAKKKNIRLRCFRNADDLINSLQGIPRETEIYLDSNLKDSLPGEVIAKKLSELGYEKLFLTTGYAPEKFDKMPWLMGVIGKKPPWI